MEESKGTTDFQEELKIPTDIQEEITELRRKEKFLSYAVVGFLLIGAFVGIKVFFAEAASAQYENYNYNQTAAPLGAGSGGGGGCCGGGSAGAGAGGGCGSGSASGPQLSAEELQIQALELYKQDTGKIDVKAVVSDRGCHTQIDLVDSSGAIVKSYGYQGGSEVYPII